MTSADAVTSTSTDTAPPIYRKVSPTDAVREFKVAIDQWWRLLDDAGKAEVTDYFHKKAGAAST
jgi:hypothetical protein